MPPQTPRPDRRRFLAWTAGAGAFFAAHGCGGVNEPKPPPPGQTGEEPKPDTSLAREAAGPRIRHLGLVSAVPLARMKEFYHGLLGLRVAEGTPECLTVDAGETRITFLPSVGGEQPFYHFAFNIPENKILAAHRWQEQRTPLLPIPKALRDPNYPDEVVNYAHWNAHSVFFFDPAGNVVEYIARHDLRNAARGEFDSDYILYASEIAFVTDDVPATTGQLKESVGLPEYKGQYDQFAALGDERGLLLVMKRGRVISFDAAEQKAVSVFPTIATVRGAKRAKWTPLGFPYEVSVEE